MEKQSEIVQILTIISPWVMGAIGVLGSTVALFQTKHNRERLDKVEGALRENPEVGEPFEDRRHEQKHVLNDTEERRKSARKYLQNRQ
jgi:hypothetical protein